MTFNILLYGATGHSGALIAAEAARVGLPGCQLILAAREGTRLARVAATYGRPMRVFSLEDRPSVLRNLVGVDLLVNAAGPFALTADRLAKAAIEVGCGYIDINGEVDVYMRMDDLARQATRQRVPVISSAGHTAAASCLMLSIALRKLGLQLADEASPEVGKDVAGPARKANLRELGAVRIALSLPTDYSRGSALTGLRLVREQVVTIRRGSTRDANGKLIDTMVKWHEPVGRLDRTFDFAPALENDTARPSSRTKKMATAANLVDTLVAAELLERGEWLAESVEGYLQMDLPARVTYQTASLMAPLMVIPALAEAARLWGRALTSDHPPGDAEQVVVLEIDDARRKRRIDWRLSVPSSHGFTAQLVVALAKGLSASRRRANGGFEEFNGWVTPADVLRYSDTKDLGGAFPGCAIVERI